MTEGTREQTEFYVTVLLGVPVRAESEDAAIEAASALVWPRSGVADLLDAEIVPED